MVFREIRSTRFVISAAARRENVAREEFGSD
jgi:hypothetical protein